MTNSKGHQLRSRAEEILQENPEKAKYWSFADVKALIHELSVHQIELEIQNEELRGATQELEASRDRYNDLYDFAPVGYFTLDREGRILEVNLTGANLLGAERVSITGKKPFRRFVAPEDLNLYHRHLAGILEDGARYSCELKLIKSEGSFFHAQLTSILEQGENGQGHRIRMAVSDITRLKEAEESLQKANEKLEDRVRERTAELEEYARKLEQSNRELEDFAHMASHDLQEPLRKIHAFSDLILSGNVSEEKGRYYFGRMQTAARRMQEMINALLTFSRITTRARPFVPVELRTMVESALSNLQVRLEETGGQVEIGDLPIIEAEPTQMVQLFQNLLGNSLKFHQEGKPPVVRVYGESIDPGFCRIYVEDEGIGFDEKYADRIFKPFERLGRKVDGTGIGLAIVKKVVDRHGGTISARSTPGKGSTFVIDLPESQKDHVSRD
jgi:two-component system, chemotaxis family, sensor kinase Cph1